MGSCVCLNQFRGAGTSERGIRAGVVTKRLSYRAPHSDVCGHPMMAGLAKSFVCTGNRQYLLRRNFGRGYRLISTNELPTVLKSRVNAPTSLPPPLTLPAPRQNSEFRISYALKLGKSYLQFYKAAVKQILGNRKIAKSIRAQHKDSPLLRGIPGDAVDHTTGKLVEHNGSVPKQVLSRAEYQLIRRHSRDIKKVPVFAILLAIFGEWLPLFVMVLDPLLPGTVLLPAQVLKRRRKAAKPVAQIGIHDLVRSKGDLEGAGIHNRAQLLQVAHRYGLLGPLSRFGTSNAILKKVRRHQAYLAIDDTLMKRDLLGDAKKEIQSDELIQEELDIAVEERGLWKEDLSSYEKLQALQKWLDIDAGHLPTTNEVNAKTQ